MNHRRLFASVIAAAAILAGALPFATSAAVSAPWDPFFAQATTIHDFGAATRPLGVAAGDFTGDGKADLFVGRVNGVAAAFTLHRGNGNGTFQAPTAYSFRVQVHNQWTFRPGDLNGDNKLDLVWGSTAAAASSGCTVSPIPTGGTCATAGGQTVTVNPGDVRVLYGNGDGTFAEGAYFVSGIRFAGGQLVGRIGATGAGSVAVGNIDADADQDVIAGGVDGANSIVKVLRNDGAGVFTQSTLISQAAACATPCSPIYFPSSSAQNSPWGLALGDADADGDQDLFVGDRALYVYLYKNNGAGVWTLTPGSTVISATRPNVYLAHESYRAAVGFTPSLAAGDVNGDGKADLALGLQSGTQTPASATAHDGELVLDVSDGSAHGLFGTLADVGTMARGTSLVDANNDGALDIVAGEYDGKLRLLRQLAPIDSDSDGVSDYVDNAPEHPNAARIDMNTDGAYNAADQLDNDFDTVLGNPEDQSTWQRLGDPADADDDNDGVADGSDNCVFVPNGGQGNVDGDALGNACDPLDDRDSDGDGVPNGPLPGDPLYDAALAAAIKWSTGDTHFVIRIDALSRLFQNEFTGLMTDAAISSPGTWAANCQGMYTPGTDPDPGCASLPGGAEVPVSLVVIPRLLWTDVEVINWINDRNDNPLFDLGQHGTYHNSGPSNTMLGDWKDDPNRNFFSCDTCGLTPAENFELMKVGYDTLMGNYANKWLVDSGATNSSPKIDWSDSANQLLSYAPPFNASDEEGRKAIALLGLKAWSASAHEEGGGPLGQFFSPDENAFEQFDKFGLFHVSADLELEPPDTTGDTYNKADYAAYLQANTDDGGLTTWLIEEVEWSGRPCNNDDRLGTCNGGSNRENNTVYLPRWEAWIQLLDYVKNYDGGVAMTMAEVALAKAFDNAPTVFNPDQADSDHDGVGDVIEGVSLAVAGGSLSRNEAGNLSATLTNGAGPLAGQVVRFEFDADGNGTPEEYSGTTDANGVATASVTATRPVGPAAVDAAWDGVRATTSGSGVIDILDASSVELDSANPATGQVTDQVTVGATLVDSDGAPLAGRSLTFTIGTASATQATDGAGHASVSLTLAGPAGPSTLAVSFAGDTTYGQSADSAAFTVAKEDTVLSLADAVASKKNGAVAVATLTEADGAALAGKTIQFQVETKVRGKSTWQALGTGVTDANGKASLAVPNQYVSRGNQPIRAIFAGNGDFLGASDDAFAYRQ